MSAGLSPANSQSSFRSAAGARILLIGFLCINCGIVTLPAIYGTVIPLLEERFSASRTAATGPLSAMLLTFGLFAPITGWLLGRFALRPILIVGCFLNAAGFVWAAYAADLFQLVLAFGLLIGPGVCLTGPVPIAAFISSSFDTDRGKALSIACMPVFMLVMPPAAALITQSGGAAQLFLLVACAFVLMMGVIYVANPRLRQSDSIDGLQTTELRGPQASNAAVFRTWKFWCLGLGAGIISGSGTAFVTHIVPLALDEGIPLAEASAILSFFGAGTIGGAFLFGVLIDRLGALAGLVINTLLQALAWGSLLMMDTILALSVIAALVGVGQGGSTALHGAAAGDLFGKGNVGRIMGLSYLVKLPFIFGWSLALGYLFDLNGNYAAACVGTGSVVALAALSFFLTKRSIEVGLKSSNGSYQEDRS